MTRTTRTANRSARLHLRANLDLARHAVELLRNKEEALQREQARLEGHAKRTEQQWLDHCRDASTWLLRARALGASSEVASMLDNASQPAEVMVAWQAAMGVTYPGEVHCTPATPPTLTSTAALVPTTAAFQKALTAGAEHAAATAALHRLETELSNTRGRRRAIEQRLQPRLETQLHQLDLDLDERDRDAAVRTQLATRRRRTKP
jgi:vacuolar-type H+-ATPase subunit D/Vma8